MHRALLKLMRLQLKGWVRRQFSAGSIRRTVFTILGIGMFLVWFLSLVFSAALSKSRPPEEILATMPFYLAGFALLPLVLGNDDRAIAFSPAEIDFLFAGPFSRRELVLYKMIKLVLTSVLGGLFFALILRRQATSFGTCAAGAVLSLVFINLLTTAIALLRDTLRERSFALVRRAAVVVLIAGVVGVAYYIKQPGATAIEHFKRLAESPWVRAVLAPARVFAHVFAARTGAEAAVWSAGCLAMIAGAGGLVLALDKGYMEAALAASQRRQDRIARASRGVMIEAGKPIKPVGLPMLRALGPAGAIVRRQAITALRTSRGWLLILVLGGVYGYFLSRVAGQTLPGIAALFPALVVLLTMLPQMLRFDFRGDLDCIEGLKALPITARAIAAAELAVPTAILSLQAWVVAGTVAAFATVPPMILVMTALAVPLVAGLLVSLENFVFLIMPSRLITPGQSGMVFSGRRVLMLLMRLGLMVVGGIFVFLSGLAASSVTHSIWATYATCWCVVAAITAAMVLAVGWAFRRFDVSVDMPT